MAVAPQRISIPFVDLSLQHRELRSRIESILSDAIDNSSFVGGPLVTQFEHNFARYCGTEHAVGVSDGTHALILALRAIGVAPDDLVLTVSHTFIATAEAVVQCGADPVFLEIDRKTYTLSPQSLSAWLEEQCRLDVDGVCRHVQSGRRVSAVIPVHLYGLPADMEAILSIADAYGLKVIEDACQAHGAWYTFSDGRKMRAGSMGDAGCFSFYPGKNLGAMGEGGAVVTNSDDVARKVRLLRDHGQTAKYIHETRYGINARLDAIQAAILDVKLERLDIWNNRRREIAAGYYAQLRGLPGLVLPQEPTYGEHVYHLFVILVDDRDQVRSKLAEAGVSTGLHYPVPIHLQKAFVDYPYKAEDLHITEHVARNLLSLPMFPHMTDEQLEYVTASLHTVLSR